MVDTAKTSVLVVMDSQADVALEIDAGMTIE